MHSMDGFGRFDAKLEWGGDQNPTLMPGTSEDFTFDIQWAGPFNPEMFMVEFSNTPPGMEMWASAKFFRGPGDISAFGAVPEPGSLALLAFGGLALMRRHRR